VLDRHAGSVAAERSSRSRPLNDADARRLLTRAQRILIASGRKTRELTASDATLDDLRGPTGNYRAPLVLVGSTLLVGFQPAALTTLLDSG
jgi:hypothetical protein